MYEIITRIVFQLSKLKRRTVGRLARMSVLDIEVDSSNAGSSMLFP